MNILSLLKNKINTLDGRVLLNGPIIETVEAVGSERSAPTSAEKKTLEEMGIRISMDDDPAHLVGSLLPNGNHKLTIDIDLPCRLEESATPGHFHLFIDKEMSVGQYEGILSSLLSAGVIQGGIYWQLKNNDMTTVRLPGVGKMVYDPNTKEPKLALKPGTYKKDN